MLMKALLLPGLKKTGVILLALTLPLPLLWFWPSVFMIDQVNYEPLHMVLNTLTIVVAILIFAVGWAAHNHELPNNLMVLICAFLGVGLLDLMDTLNHPGSPLFVTSGSPEQLVDFWLAARIFALLGLFSVLFPPRDKLPMQHRSYAYPIVVVLIVLGLYALRQFFSLFPQLSLHQALLMQMFVISEYVFTTLFALLLLLFYRARDYLPPYIGVNLLAGTFLFLLSELCFVTYSGEKSPLMLLAYGYKLAAHLLVYRLVLMSAMERPYRKLTESRQALQGERAFLQNVLNGISDSITVVDQQYKVILMNKAAQRIATSSDGEKQLCYQIFQNAHRPCHSSLYPCPMEEIRHKQKPLVWEHEFANAQGKTQIVEISATPLWKQDGDFLGIIEVVRDITLRRQTQDQLRINQDKLVYLSRYDPLTDLPNRLLFQDRLHHAIVNAHKGKINVALLFLDLDHFKNINDTLGHIVGDKLLKEVAERLLGGVREEDMVARLGGDEFTVILDELQHTHTVPLAARKIINLLKRPFHIDGHELYVSTSIGISIYPVDGHDVKTLVRAADTAMYSAKARGRNNYQFFTEDLNQRALRRLTLDARLRKAMDNKELEVYYQPQVDIRSNRIVSAEALLRWPSHDKGFIASPAEFIPLAEESGLIVPLGEWVMHTACKQNHAWQLQGLTPLVMAVNLSAQQFRQADLLERVQLILRETGLAARYLELELTESILLVDDAEQVIKIMQQLKESGIRLSIDDFGTGYSSLSYLKRFPLDQLKIAQEFVRDLSSDPNDAAIAQAVISLAKSLKLEVIAEGVETKEHLAFFQQHHCELAQGYFFSPPLSAQDFTRLLQETSILVGGGKMSA